MYYFLLVTSEVIGVVGFPADEFLVVGPLAVVLRQVTHPQEGSQHQ